MLRPDQPIVDHAGKQVAKLRYRTLEQMQSALELCDRHSKDGNKDKRGLDGSTGGRQSFTGTDNAQDYLTMLRDGWAHGVSGVEGLDGLSTDKADKIGFVRNVGGAFPLVPAFLHGAPDAMLMPRLMPAESVRGLTLVIDACFHAGVDSQTVLNYARSVMKLVAWLAAEQIEVAVYVVVPILMRSAGRFLYVTPIRQAGDVMQPERIAAILHPSWLRRAWFAMVEHEFHDHSLPGTSVCNGSYGSVTSATADEMQQALPESYSVIMLPKVGRSNPFDAVKESITLKLRQGE